MSPPQFSIPLQRMGAGATYWRILSSVAGILVFALFLGAVFQFLRPHPIPWIEDHSQSVDSKARAAGIRVVTLEQAREMVANGSALVLDARAGVEFDLGHLPGAVSFPNATRSDAFYELAGLLQGDQPLLVYCWSKSCDDALELALFLRAQGSKNVHLFAGGFNAWRDAGFPVE